MKLERVQENRMENPPDGGCLRAVIDGIPDPVMMIDPDFRVRFMNRAARLHSADASPLLCHQVLYQSRTPCNGSGRPCPLEMVRDTLAPVTVVHETHDSKGNPRVYELHAAPHFDDERLFVGIVETLRDVTEHRRCEEEAKRLTHYDVLTGLPNRLLFFDRLEQALISAQREGRLLAVALIDLDRFHRINDSLGHSAGDRVLIDVAERLHGCALVGATVARTGASQFMMLLPALSTVEKAMAIPKLIRAALKSALRITAEEVFLTASVGIGVFPDDGGDRDTLLKNAASALNRAQQKGGDGYQLYSPALNETASRGLYLETGLRKALQYDQFELHYQPQISLTTGLLTGLEALLRWRDDEGDLIQPGEFIPILEETGLITSVGEWVLRSVGRQHRLWQKVAKGPLRVAVNLSSRQFKQGDLVATVQRAVKEIGFDPQWLELELTESMLMDDVFNAQATMHQLKEMGIRLAIDDFGTGYSSLAYLTRFPIDTLKIDRSFITGVTDNSDDATITSIVIEMAHRLGLEVVAEGVETERQLRFLQTLACDTVQGFLVGRPMPVEQVTEMLASPVPSSFIGLG